MTISYCIFSAFKSTDLDGNKTSDTTTGKRDSSAGPVAKRGNDPLRKVKLNRRRSALASLSPAQEFGVKLKQVPKPKGTVSESMDTFFLQLFA